MNRSKVVGITYDNLQFNNDDILCSSHESDCCESHYLSFEHLSLDEFDGLEFDLTSDNFFERIDGYGIALKPLSGHPVRIPGYGRNNGYYSSNLDLVVTDSKGVRKKVFDVSNCQVVTD